jgi:hypothetical protein
LQIGLENSSGIPCVGHPSPDNKLTLKCQTTANDNTNCPVLMPLTGEELVWSGVQVSLSPLLLHQENPDSAIEDILCQLVPID